MKQVGLIGSPVSHSLSPQMQQAAFDALGIEARYFLWETRAGALAQRITSLRSPEFLGANVTIPYKEDVVPLLDECDPGAAKIGAVNTIVNRDGRLVGSNTDAPGFIWALADAAFDSHGKKAVILGTGGSARAAAVALVESGVEELVLLGRTNRYIDGLVNHLRALDSSEKWGVMGVDDRPAGATQASPPHIHTTPAPTRIQGALLGSPDVGRFLCTADLLVNTTPVGLRADDATLLIDVDLLQSSAFVVDIVFNPPETPLLRAARARGCRVLNGLPMLLYQGVLAFELWTGRAAPLELMRAALGLVEGR